jgi:hypothetical protein
MAGKIIATYQIGNEICDALGLEHVVDADISLHLDGIPQVTVTYFPNEEHLKAALKIIKKFKIVPLDE